MTKQRQDITAEELDKFQKAFKDEKFRKLFHEYVEEISDPKNKEKYEQEITALEAERGNNIKWIKPTPGFVVKTRFVESPPPPKLASKDDVLVSSWPNDVQKAFINICHCREIAEAVAKPVPGKSSGVNWSIPYSLGIPRVDVDKEKKECIVYDCSFHTDFYNRSKTDNRFLNLMVSTAMDGIEKQYVGVKLKREYVVLKNVTVKGEIKATVIRTPSTDKPSSSTETSSDYLEKQFQASRSAKPTSSTPAPAAESGGQRPLIEPIDDGGASASRPAAARSLPTPVHKVTHSNTLSYQQFTNPSPNLPPLSTRPEKLTVTVEYPALTTSADLDIDVIHEDGRSTLKIAEIKDKYAAIIVPLPFECVEGGEVARFERAKGRLVIVFDVVPPPALKPVDLSEGKDVPIEKDEDREMDDSDAAMEKNEQADGAREAGKDETAAPSGTIHDDASKTEHVSAVNAAIVSEERKEENTTCDKTDKDYEPNDFESQPQSIINEEPSPTVAEKESKLQTDPDVNVTSAAAPAAEDQNAISSAEALVEKINEMQMTDNCTTKVSKMPEFMLAANSMAFDLD